MSHAQKILDLKFPLKHIDRVSFITHDVEGPFKVKVFIMTNDFMYECGCVFCISTQVADGLQRPNLPLKYSEVLLSLLMIY